MTGADLMCETHGYGDEVVGRTIVTERYKYIATGGQMHELYDLQDDPYELTNLIADPGYKEILADLRRRLATWQELTSDDESALD